MVSAISVTNAKMMVIVTPLPPFTSSLSMSPLPSVASLAQRKRDNIGDGSGIVRQHRFHCANDITENVSAADAIMCIRLRQAFGV